MFFGEYGIINNIEKPIRASCITDVTCLNINKDDFFFIFTSKDIKDIQEHSHINIPSKEELEKKVLDELESKKTSENALFDALDIQNSSFDGRDTLLDSKAKKSKKWINYNNQRNIIKTRALKKRIVSEESVEVNLNSIPMANSYRQNPQSK